MSSKLPTEELCLLRVAVDSVTPSLLTLALAALLSKRDKGRARRALTIMRWLRRDVNSLTCSSRVRFSPFNLCKWFSNDETGNGKKKLYCH